MPVRPILLLGDPALYRPSSPVREDDLTALAGLFQDLRDTFLHYRVNRGPASGMAAPQIGVHKRVVYLDAPRPHVLLNPAVEPTGTVVVEMWENCMSFPELLVKVRRSYACTLWYRDREWRDQSRALTGQTSVVAQHECDHLDGVLAVAKAADGESFCLTSQRHHTRRLSQPGRAIWLHRHSGGC